MKIKQMKWLAMFLLLSLHGIMSAAVDDDKTGTIRGLVIDANSGEPIEYATIAVYDAQNNVVTGTVTDVKGVFKVSGLNWGVYHLQLSFMGYDAHRVENLSVTNDKPSHNLGTVRLAANTEKLNEVEVVAERKQFEYKIDKKVVNVSGQATAASMTAIEVLENVPSVKVDVEGNVSLRGSGGFTVLIDGKPSILDASDALRQIPASAIDNIEIITNPSVKFEPDGTAGIINVITKKNKLLGVSGQAAVNAGMYGTYGGDALLNYRHKKVNYIFGGDYNRRVFPGENENERRSVVGDQTNYLISKGEGERDMRMWGLRGGVEVDFNPKNSMTLSARMGGRDMIMESPQSFHEFNDAGLDNRYSSLENWHRQGQFYALNGTYVRQFAQKGHQVSTQFNISHRDATEESSNEKTSDGTLLEKRRNLEDGPGDRAELKIDYTLPFSETNKLEAGYQGRWESESDETALENWDLLSGAWVPNAQYGNNTEGEQQIHGLYAMYAGMWRKFGYQAGLRGETTRRTISSNLSAQQFELDRFDLYPTLHLSLQLPWEQQLMGGYSRRIQRTHGWMLEPFITWVNAYYVRQGNADLEPEFIDSYELGYVKQFENAFVSFEAYHRVTHNKVENLQRQWEGDPSGNILMGQPFNVGKDYSTGLELSINLRQLKWWEVNLMGNLYNYEVTGSAGGKDFSNQTFNWGARLNNTFKVARLHQLQFNGQFNSPTATAQGEVHGYYSFDAAYRVDLFKRKLSAVVQARDLFATGKRISTTEGENFYTWSKWGMKAPLVSMTLTYRFNNYMPKRMTNRNGGEDIMNEGGEF
ncbi:outer membrane receptor protein involved in Fe transport [Breznakibacter xylanolyticus]|uniref:Outer membrane receptor protein involved in Fe transport n=1 Tax=Breznakibacter xylanolyticus TaxID=990 RepID=A0A2W7NAV0_9BACT|nr:TonB-dependent receptor [Breznakibacter xylanolyticus]PZX17431.1 outer membrane receptor protein involved in Fe transport [Breznakibacter xylanolyticus]